MDLLAITLPEITPRTRRNRAMSKARRDAIRAVNVLLLRDVWGYTVPEVAAELGRADRTVQRAHAAGRKAVPPRVIEALRRMITEVDACGFHVDPDPDESGEDVDPDSLGLDT